MQAYFAFLPSNWDVFHPPANNVADMHVLVISKVHPKSVLVHLQNWTNVRTSVFRQAGNLLGLGVYLKLRMNRKRFCDLLQASLLDMSF